MANKKVWQRKIDVMEQGYRYDLPLVLTEAVVGAEDEPLLLTPTLSRGFLDALLSVWVLGAASFMTIFAWISSSLLALTFLGQKRVTNLVGKGGRVRIVRENKYV
jgi:hypothetical protein